MIKKPENRPKPADPSLSQSEAPCLLIAFGAGKAKIVCVVGAAMLPGDDVFNVKGLELVLVLMEPAVFTAAAGPLPGEGSEDFVHHSPLDAASSWRAFDFRMAMNVA